MKTPKPRLLAALAMSLGVLAGCSTTTAPTADQHPPQDPPRVAPPDARNPVDLHDDTGITRRVQAAVLGVPGIQGHTVQVSTQDGVVTLRGIASNETAARNAVQAARQVTGVRTLDYDLQVQPYGSDASTGR